MALVEFVDNQPPYLNASNLNNNFNELNKVSRANDPTLLTNITPIEITPTAGSNYSGYGNSYFYKIGTRVHIHLGLQGLTANTNQYVATIPEGYRPRGTLAIVGLGATQTEIIGGQAYPGGSISIQPVSQYALFDYEYDAFN